MAARFEPVRMPLCACPVCLASLDAATDPTGANAVPGPGDLTICLHCTAVLQFDAARLPLRMDAAAMATLDADARALVLRGVRMAQQFQQWRKQQ